MLSIYVLPTEGLLKKTPRAAMQAEGCLCNLQPLYIPFGQSLSWTTGVLPATSSGQAAGHALSEHRWPEIIGWRADRCHTVRGHR